MSADGEDFELIAHLLEYWLVTQLRFLFLWQAELDIP